MKRPPVSRRRFFRAFLGEASSLLAEASGIPQRRLDALAELPDRMLEEMVPCAGSMEILRWEENRLVRVGPEASASEVVCAFSALECCALGLFDGRHTLGQVADELARRPELGERGAAFAMAKRLFCDLARLMVFVPQSAGPGVSEASPGGEPMEVEQ